MWTITDSGLLIKIDQHESHWNCVWTITDSGLFIKIDQHEPHLTDFVCLYNYEFWLSLCKIVRSSVILLLPLLRIKIDQHEPH